MRSLIRSRRANFVFRSMPDAVRVRALRLGRAQSTSLRGSCRGTPSPPESCHRERRRGNAFWGNRCSGDLRIFYRKALLDLHRHQQRHPRACPGFRTAALSPRGTIRPAATFEDHRLGNISRCTAGIRSSALILKFGSCLGDTDFAVAKTIAHPTSAKALHNHYVFS
jgi:hypothetical protein